MAGCFEIQPPIVSTAPNSASGQQAKSHWSADKQIVARQLCRAAFSDEKSSSDHEAGLLVCLGDDRTGSLKWHLQGDTPSTLFHVDCLDSELAHEDKNWAILQGLR